MKIDPRFTQEAGLCLFTGNELLVKGALETPGGVNLLTGYPGSPVAGFFDAAERIGPLLAEHGVVARMAVNEAISVAMLNGLQMVGGRGIAAFKSVGGHVAADALALGVLAGVPQGGGGLIVLGDDPWNDSTQVPADSRYLAEHLRLPIIEPCGPQEVKDFIDLSFRIGTAANTYVGYLMTVTNADGGGSVVCKPNHFPEVNDKQRKALKYTQDVEPYVEETVLLPPRTSHQEATFADRFEKAIDAARDLGVNRILHRPQKGDRAAVGFIAAGSAYGYLAQALEDMGMTAQCPILKLGMVYPVDGVLVERLAGMCRNVVVIEERRGFVERQVRDALAQSLSQDAKRVELYGKRLPGNLDGIPETRGLNPSLLVDRLAPLFDHFAPDYRPALVHQATHLAARMRATAKGSVDLPNRIPGFCPGCPHRDSSSVLLELRDDLLDADYMEARHRRGPVDLVAHGDTGCYTMLMFEPNKTLMHNYSGMGLGGGTGAGVDPFIDNKQIVFMGDGTFHHSGQIAIGQSIYTGQDITYIILENKTTAMTGHQPHSGVETDISGRSMNPMDIERIVAGMVPANLKRDVRIVRMDPSDRDRYRAMLEKTILADGVKIVIADKECGITFHRRARRVEAKLQREKGFIPKKTFMNVNEEACEYCLECALGTGCPGLTNVETDYGPKMATDLSWCVNDGACQRIDACPAFEEITVVRKQAPQTLTSDLTDGELPAPGKPIHASRNQWRCHLAGVGGMGIGTATAMLVEAGNAMGFHVQFVDKKGLAIRNGGVYSQVVFARRDDDDQPPATTPHIAYGTADLLLGVDLMEATRGVDPSLPYRVASPDRTAAVVNTAPTLTILMLLGKDKYDHDRIEASLKQHVRNDQYFAANVGELSERILGNKLYANVMMLGVAMQRGYLPLTLEAVESAIRKVAGGHADANLKAFTLGRRIAAWPQRFAAILRNTKAYEPARVALRKKVALIDERFGSATAKQFRVLMRQTFRATRGLRVADRLMRDVIVRAHDCVVWGGRRQGIDYARRYCDRLVRTFHKDHPEQGFAVTEAVVHNLAKVMLIKDEPYVSALLTSPEKYRRDAERFKVDRSRGDKIKYRHHNRPEFDLLGQKVRFTWKSTDWQLALMSKARFLRSWLPKWHERERDFRDWYERLVDEWDRTGDDRDYTRWQQVFATPSSVTGYREVRYPKMVAARKTVRELLAAPITKFQPPGDPRVIEKAEKVELPLLTVG
ncbi:MAG: 2-oxoacid:acceptor oxidoreductase family protein [Planctomycetota bacterium]